MCLVVATGPNQQVWFVYVCTEHIMLDIHVLEDELYLSWCKIRQTEIPD